MLYTETIGPEASQSRHESLVADRSDERASVQVFTNVVGYGSRMLVLEAMRVFDGSHGSSLIGYHHTGYRGTVYISTMISVSVACWCFERNIR